MVKRRVLFIGNSYTHCNNLPSMTTQLAASANPADKLDTNQVTPGGKTLEYHFTNPETLSAIQQGGWHTVVLQDHSLRPVEARESMNEFAAKLHELVLEQNAETVFYMTWPRKFAPEKLDIYIDAYKEVAAELGARVAPVGAAWYKVLAEKPDLELYTADESHPNALGTYIGACTFYSTLFGRSPVGLTNTISLPEDNELEVDADLAELFQKSAWQAFNEHAR
jgi:hypothetical protein